jgi:tartrate dehydratase alpha subunit/fumarate hydratase class I-like protein
MRQSRNIENEEQRQLRLEAEAIAQAMAQAEAMAMTELAQEHQEQLERAVQETKTRKSQTRKKSV